MSFCEHRHFFVSIAKFVMVNEVKGIPVEMAQFSSRLPHASTVENISMVGSEHEFA